MKGKRRRFWKILWGLVILFFVMFLAAQFVHILAPYYTLNPFVHKVTIGEDVIGKWKYGGVDDAGRLQFYNGFQTVKVPAALKSFDAEGTYVVVSEYTPSTITIQTPWAIILQWMIVWSMFTLVLAAGVLSFRPKRRRARGSRHCNLPSLMQGQSLRFFLQRTFQRKRMRLRRSFFVRWRWHRR